MSKPFYVPARSVAVTYEVKKSLFHAQATPVSSREKALEALADAKKQYADARHHCWAYVIENGRSAASSDAGEPSGTAGKPILNVLQHKNISDVMLVVSRYFGGVKLGAGGLVRAYSASAQLAVDHLELKAHEARSGVAVECDFADEQRLRHWLGIHGGQLIDCSYADRVIISFRLPSAEIDTCKAFCEANGMGPVRVL